MSLQSLKVKLVVNLVRTGEGTVGGCSSWTSLGLLGNVPFGEGEDTTDLEGLGSTEQHVAFLVLRKNPCMEYLQK